MHYKQLESMKGTLQHLCDDVIQLEVLGQFNFLITNSLNA